ncbi:MAG: type II toxin-antitoxin system RelB/DinJ family antitoxin [Erysipelotrichaceae bacterium]|nr:type II toxin-antitoxin system RelB/DinJ family antitoxin [Erysipelotrichaceae bacterium]
MSNYDSSLTVRTNSRVKKSAKELYADLGLDLSTAINVFLRKSVECGGFPFEVRKKVPNERLMAAIKEADDILDGKIEAKRYSSAKEMLEDVMRE